MHALKDNGSHELFAALSKALDKGKDRAIVYAPPCAVCGLEVGQGFPHADDCSSEEAARYRVLPVPLVDPLD
jgi:hypothetical protein